MYNIVIPHFHSLLRAHHDQCPLICRHFLILVFHTASSSLPSGALMLSHFLRVLYYPLLDFLLSYRHLFCRFWCKHFPDCAWWCQITTTMTWLPTYLAASDGAMHALTGWRGGVCGIICAILNSMLWTKPHYSSYNIHVIYTCLHVVSLSGPGTPYFWNEYFIGIWIRCT